jgi:hypothetical protein
MNVRAMCLIVALMGLFVLMYVMMAPAREVEGLEDSVLRENVIVIGLVESERGISTGTAMIVGDIEVRYLGFDSYQGKYVRVEGYVDEFHAKRYVVAQSISIVS